MTDLATTLYTALLSDGRRLRDLRRMQYRCDNQRHCLLLDAIDTTTPEGILLHQLRYKYSPEENERRSSEAGRQKNTYDGENHWRERTYFIGQSALAYPEDGRQMRLGISCDHVLDFPLYASDFHADFDAGHAEIRVRRDGSRYAVR